MSVQKLYPYLLALILVLGFLTKVVRLEVPQKYIFDEVYHVYTAKLYLQNLPEAYDPFAPAPAGVGHEWTHPPLGKLIMALSMLCFGQDSFGWRFSSVVFGTLVVYLTASFALALTGSQVVALLSALFATADGLLFVQSRIGMVDIHLICFMLATYLLYLRWKAQPQRLWSLLLCGVFLGAGLATKWSMLFVYGALATDLMLAVLRDKLALTPAIRRRIYLGWGLLPVGIYAASYTHALLSGVSLRALFALQRHMLVYHATLEATHQYASKPWQWILDLRPVWIYSDRSVPGLIASIYNIGNPVILYGGLLSMLLLFFRLFYRSQRSDNFLILCYLWVWVPWIFSPRILLFYHYAPAVPILCIAFARAIELLRPRELLYIVTCMFSVAGSYMWLVLFYPHLSGLAMPEEFVNAIYFLVPSWK